MEPSQVLESPLRELLWQSGNREKSAEMFGVGYFGYSVGYFGFFSVHGGRAPQTLYRQAFSSLSNFRTIYIRKPSFVQALQL